MKPQAVQYFLIKNYLISIGNMAGEIVKARLKEALDGVAKACADIVRTVMDSDIGINDKIGTNTLTGSNAYQKIEGVNVDDIGLINLLIPEYAVLYVDGDGYMWARRPADPDVEGHREDQVPPPIEAIKEWASRKNLPTTGSFIWKARWSVWWKGVKARHFIEPSFEEIDKQFETWADDLFEALCVELDEFFKD